MQTQEREAIIQQIVDASNHEANESGKQRVLVEWRAKLEKEPPLLKPYQIDVIVREVRGRLDRTAR